ncbi:MAG TPA: hypothetical protein VKO83_03665 [Steroidobacteraceae bacterium]|nr:hypothetical protein [Steroidobacteraceae bacterium]
MNIEADAAARQRLLVVLAALLEGLYDDAAVKVLETLKPADMRSGGARIPGTSYELPPRTAARAMQQLLAIRGVTSATALTDALADADVQARLAALTGQQPPVVGGLYPLCTAGLSLEGSESLRAALLRLYVICEKFFTLTHMRRIDELLYDWGQSPQHMDAMPVQKFIAQFVRNAPPPHG